MVETLIERGFAVHAINPKQMDRFRDHHGRAKDDSRDAEVMASCLRTDPRCFRLLAAADPIIIELREWSRIAEDLGVERNRIVNRLREQLWRYFPALLELEADLGAEWLLELWEAAPTPDKASRLREATIGKLLKRHRIRRFDAAFVVNTLRRPPVRVAAGTGRSRERPCRFARPAHPPAQPSDQRRPQPDRRSNRPPHASRGGRAGAEKAA